MSIVVMSDCSFIDYCQREKAIARFRSTKKKTPFHSTIRHFFST